MGKKTLYLVLLVFVMIGCGDAQTPDFNETLLIGKWKMVTAEFYRNGELDRSESLKAEDCDYDYYHFKEDKTKDEVYHNPNSNCISHKDAGKWSYNVQTRQITLTDHEDSYIFIAEIAYINENTAKFKVVSDGGEKPENMEIYYILEFTR